MSADDAVRAERAREEWANLREVDRRLIQALETAGTALRTHEVAERAGYSDPVAGRRLRKLDERGMVVRRPDPANADKCVNHVPEVTPEWARSALKEGSP